MTDELLQSYVVKTLLQAQMGPNNGVTRDAIRDIAMSDTRTPGTSSSAAQETVKVKELQNSLAASVVLAPHVLTKDVQSTSLSIADALYGTGRLNVVPGGMKSLAMYFANPRKLHYEEIALYDYLANGSIDSKAIQYSSTPQDVMMNLSKLMFINNGASESAARLFGPTSGLVSYSMGVGGLTASPNSDSTVRRSVSWILAVELAREVFDEYNRAQWQAAARGISIPNASDHLITMMACIYFVLGQGKRFIDVKDLTSHISTLLPSKASLSNVVVRKKIKHLLKMTRPVVSSDVIDYISKNEHISLVHLGRAKHKLDAVTNDEDSAAIHFLPSSTTEFPRFIKQFISKK